MKFEKDVILGIWGNIEVSIYLSREDNGFWRISDVYRHERTPEPLYISRNILKQEKNTPCPLSSNDWILIDPSFGTTPDISGNPKFNENNQKKYKPTIWFVDLKTNIIQTFEYKDYVDKMNCNYLKNVKYKDIKMDE